MEHSFDIDLAKEIGIEEAIIFKHICYWLQKNEANEQNQFDGDTWTYNSVKAFNEIFFYMSPKKIRSALAKLEELGLIKTGNYNKVSFDRTKWYALTEKGKSIFLKGKSICPNGEIHLPKRENGSAQKGKPIPNINQINNTDKKPDIDSGVAARVGLRGKDLETAKACGFADDEGLLSAFTDFYQMRKSIKKPMTGRAVKMLSNELEKLAPGNVELKIEILNQSSFHCWQGVYELQSDSYSLETPKPVITEPVEPEDDGIDLFNCSDEEFDRRQREYALRNQRAGHI